MKKIIILLTVIAVMAFMLTACGGGKDKQETKSEGQTIDFQEIQFMIPDYYVLDEDGSDDKSIYYKYIDDGVLHKMVMVQFRDDITADFSNEEGVKSYEESIIDGETFYGSDGFKTVKIDDQLSAIETSCKYDGDNGTSDVEIMAFNDGDLHPYMILIVTDDGSSKKQMQDINDSFRYSFDVAGSSGSEEAEEPEKEESEYYFKDNVIKTKDRTIKITKWEVIKPGKNPYSSLWYQDEPAIAFWYEVTNDSDENITMATSWEWAVELLQDNSDDYENTLSYAQIPDDSLTENYLEEIKPGGTLKCATAYKLTDETTPVTLIAKNGLLGEELGRKDYKIK